MPVAFISRTRPGGIAKERPSALSRAHPRQSAACSPLPQNPSADSPSTASANMPADTKRRCPAKEVPTRSVDHQDRNRHLIEDFTGHASKDHPANAIAGVGAHDQHIRTGLPDLLHHQRPA